MATLRDRFRGCLLGVALGDALGAPFEGRSLVNPTDVDRWASASEPLRWTDDTHMTIGLSRSLLACGGFDGPHLAGEFVRTFQAEPWRGYGAGPPQVFAALAAGEPWDAPAARLFRGQGSFGNGAAMRVAPVGLVAHRAFDTLVALARQTARVTHAHELGQQAAALQAAAVGWLVTAKPVPGWDGAASLVDDLREAAPAAEFQRQLDRLRQMDPSSSVRRVVAALGHGVSGVEAVPAALHAFLRHPLSLSDAIRYAVQLGGDTDTIGCMTGALAGAFLGEAAIVASWRRRLEAASVLTELADGLVELSRQVPES